MKMQNSIKENEVVDLFEKDWCTEQPSLIHVCLMFLYMSHEDSLHSRHSVATNIQICSCTAEAWYPLDTAT